MSTLGVTSIGWFLVGLVYVPLSIIWVVLARGRWRSRPRKSAVFALLVYVPLAVAVAESFYVDMRFRALCATAGEQIKRSVVVEGFYDDGYTQYWDDSLTSPERYRFVEWKARDGGIWRTERVGPGQVRKFQIDKPTARYHWRHPKFPSPYGHLMQRREDTIVDTETGEVIARSVMGYRYPAFIDSLWARFMGGEPSICGFGSVLSKTLVGIDLKVQEK